MDDLLIRFLIRGLVVSAFSSLGDILRPKKTLQAQRSHRSHCPHAFLVLPCHLACGFW
jgi:hypothetical protein